MSAFLLFLLVLFGIGFALVLFVVGLYNGLIQGRNAYRNAFAQIDVQLNRRYDLIPNLVETVRGYARHEEQLMTNVIAARNTAAAAHGSPREQAADENALIGQLRQLVAVAESYPDLKANRNFLALQTELTNTEDRIQRARRFYNANVRDLNTRVEVIPSNIIANLFGFKKREYFEIDDAKMREAPKVDV